MEYLGVVSSVVLLPVFLNLVSNYAYDWLKERKKPEIRAKYLVISFVTSLLLGVVAQIVLVYPGIRDGVFDENAVAAANLVSVAGPLCAVIGALIRPAKTIEGSIITGFTMTLVGYAWIGLVLVSVLRMYGLIAH